MPTVRATVTAEGDVGSRIVLAPPGSPAIVGDGNLDITCGACGTMLILHARARLQFSDFLIRCPRCHQCNHAVIHGE